MTVQFDNPNPTFFDKDTNLPLGGGYVYFYVAGSSTPAPTYQDSALSVLNTSPYIVLNAAGNFTNPVFMPAGNYKIVVYSAGGISSGVLQWTRDNYQVVSVASFTASVIPNEQTGTTYTIQTTDRGGLISFNSGSAVAVSLPQAGTNFPNGWYCYAYNLGAGTVTITPSTSTIDGNTTLKLLTGQGALITSDATNYFTSRNVINPSGELLTIASATTTDLGSINSHFLSITGTTTITGLGSSANISNPLYYITFAGILTFTYDGTKLIIPGAANITTAANDCALVEYLGSGNWRVLQYFYASGVLPLAAGGTGAISASAARTSLGLGTIATQNANSVSITGGSVVGATGSAKGYTSTAIALSSGATGSVSHGLGATPLFYGVFLQNQSTDQGYTSGQEVPLYDNNDSNNQFGLINGSSTISYVQPSSVSSIYVANASTGASANIDSTKWKFVIKALVIT